MSSNNKPKTGAGKAGADEAAAKKAAAEAEAKKAAEEAAAAAAAQSDKPGQKVPALRVISKRDGFRRGGRAWSKEETTVKLSELSDEQVSQIKGESMLEVEEVEIDG